MAGLTFDAGFAADHHLFSRWGNGTGTYNVDFINRQGGGVATVPGSSGSSPNAVGLQAAGSISAGKVGTNAPGAALTQALEVAINDNNAARGTRGPESGHGARPAAGNTGIGISLGPAG